MIRWLIKTVIGTKNDREIRRLRPLVARINEIEASLQSLRDEDLREKTARWKAELSQIQDDAELARRLDELLPEAFAVVKNVCRRLTERREKIIVRGHEMVWDMIPFDVQLIGGWALHHGRIAEMATGEGKTLVATLPVYLNALTGRGVHVVTVNDGRGVPVSGPDRGLHPARPAARGAPPAVLLRHHLRHERRVRL
jgi:preprotein translocase subunit SecA